MLLTVAQLVLLYTLSASALWPIPRSLSTGTSPLKLSSSFRIHVASVYPSDVHDAAKRTQYLLFHDHLARLVSDRGRSDENVLKHAPVLQGLKLVLDSEAKETKGIAAETIRPLEERDEAYTLTVPIHGEATITAKSALGLWRGLTTFSQIWYTHQGTGAVYTLEAPVTIADEAAYPYRGFMLDTARNFFPVEDIKRTLDAMSWVKMSQFHWHVTDSQSFPLVIPGYHEIAENGAYSAEETYSEKDVKEIVAYAAARGIDVLPEIDTPGHTTSISYSHPEHIACIARSPWTTYANEPPAGQLRLASPSTTAFTSSLLRNAATLFSGTFFSTGGDELNEQCYKDDEETQAILKKEGKTLETKLDEFVQATHKALKKEGKTAVVWQEMVIKHEVKLADDTVVLVWISSQDAKKVAQKGYRFVHAPSDYFYLDCGSGEWIGNRDPTANSWCDPFKSWQRAYSFDPLANLTPDEAKLVLGGQQLLWAEQSGPANLDSQVWPRAAVSAEIFWSGSATTDVYEAQPRLHDIAFRMAKRGVRVSPIAPTWCALRPGACLVTS